MSKKESPLNNKSKENLSSGSNSNTHEKQTVNDKNGKSSQANIDDIASMVPDDISEDDELYKKLLKDTGLLYEENNTELDNHSFHKQDKEAENEKKDKEEYSKIENKYKKDGSIIRDYEDFINDKEEKQSDSDRELKDQLELNLYSLSSTKKQDLSTKNIDQEFLYDITSEIDKEKSVSKSSSEELKNQIQRNFKFIKHKEDDDSINDEEPEEEEENNENAKIKQGFPIGTLLSWLILMVVLFLAYYWFQINVNKYQMQLKSKIVLLDSIRNSAEEVDYKPELNFGNKNYISHEVTLKKEKNATTSKDNQKEEDKEFSDNKISNIKKKVTKNVPQKTTLNDNFPIRISVKREQTLMDIAEKYYNNKIFWVYVYLDNSSVIQDPNVVYTGTKLIIQDPKKHNINSVDSTSFKDALILQRAFFNINKK